MGETKEHIEDVPITFSDSWRAYKTEELQAAGFEHFKVNHWNNFVNSDTGAHMQNIECIWGSAKCRNKKHCERVRQHCDGDLTSNIAF